MMIVTSNIELWYSVMSTSRKLTSIKRHAICTYRFGFNLAGSSRAGSSSEAHQPSKEDRRPSRTPQHLDSGHCQVAMLAACCASVDSHHCCKCGGRLKLTTRPA